ncbi:hypothetical protein KEM63_09065 [Halopseudomonas nanhaiensis]|uniref:CsiV family protein n=1 Tax=Halopseudomonas nanhaiensis TaxID=2830842 RepID=UPI001CBD8AAA|nr:CsiV family protein [Halopseudomonas nanhaiensis]UAW96988.1 hypothetical protein KEM63_09065 [Halopseudomonas nanhaiensis]
MRPAFLRSLGGFTLLCLSLLPSVVQAQSTENVIVEVALFSQPSARLLPAESADLDWADSAIVLSETANSQVRSIDVTRRQLGDEMDRLARQGYRLHLHTAWTQPLGLGNPIAVSDDDATSSPDAGVDPLPRVQGLVSVKQNQGLEADVSFWLNQGTADGRLVTEKLRQTRRLRLDETHYLDHPSLGVLIRVWRAD